MDSNSTDYEADYEGYDSTAYSTIAYNLSNPSNVTQDNSTKIIYPNLPKLQITYTTTEQGSSVNILINTNAHISSNDTNQHYKRIFIPMIENKEYSFTITNDTTNLSTDLSNIQLDGTSLTCLNDQLTNVNNGIFFKKYVYYVFFPYIMLIDAPKRILVFRFLGILLV